MATCKECIHYDICFIRDELSDDESKVVSVLECTHCKDRSRFIELPISIHKTFYLIMNGNIAEFRLSTECPLTWEGKIFYTREEAEQALKERERIE